MFTIYYLGVVVSAVIWVFCFYMVTDDMREQFLSIPTFVQFLISVTVTLLWVPLFFFIWGIFGGIISFFKVLIKK